MTKIGSLNFNTGDFSSKKVQTEKTTENESTPHKLSQDYSCTDRKPVILSNPFDKKVNLKDQNTLSGTTDLQKDLDKSRANRDAQGIFKVAKIQHEKNILPNLKANELLKEAYELALSEMDSDTLYDIGNFDAQNNLLKDVSSEHIFKMADMTRKIY